MIRALLVLVLAGLSGPAFALSCLPHDVARTFQQAAEAEDAYIVVHGALRFDETRLPKMDMANQQQTPPDTLIPAQITGKALSHDGFTIGFDRKITLNAQCFGPWCAGAISGMDYLAFLEKRADGYRLSITPCGGFGFGSPSKAKLDTVKACFGDGPCAPTDLR